mmetsp:Transcript_27459/g.84741  ORF Transcript_27459/g.84741 Transcript_27459/m.84741 type:complete len:521 (+) Transcript_27459:198-1760(+)
MDGARGRPEPAARGPRRRAREPSRFGALVASARWHVTFRSGARGPGSRRGGPGHLGRRRRRRRGARRGRRRRGRGPRGRRARGGPDGHRRPRRRPAGRAPRGARHHVVHGDPAPVLRRRLRRARLAGEVADGYRQDVGLRPAPRRAPRGAQEAGQVRRAEARPRARDSGARADARAREAGRGGAQAPRGDARLLDDLLPRRRVVRAPGGRAAARRRRPRRDGRTRHRPHRPRQPGPLVGVPRRPRRGGRDAVHGLRRRRRAHLRRVPRGRAPGRRPRQVGVAVRRAAGLRPRRAVGRRARRGGRGRRRRRRPRPAADAVIFRDVAVVGPQAHAEVPREPRLRRRGRRFPPAGRHDGVAQGRARAAVERRARLAAGGHHLRRALAAPRPVVGRRPGRRRPRDRLHLDEARVRRARGRTRVRPPLGAGAPRRHRPVAARGDARAVPPGPVLRARGDGRRGARHRRERRRPGRAVPDAARHGGLHPPVGPHGPRGPRRDRRRAVRRPRGARRPEPRARGRRDV